MTVNATSPLQITIYPENSGSGSSTSSAASPSSSHGQFWSGEGPTFKDVLDTINPLQHIPVISSIYQSLTGDTQSTGAKLTGGALFGGVVGFVGSLFDTIIQSTTGTDIAGNIMAGIEGKPIPALHNGMTQTADADGQPGFLSANQRASYNAYVHTQNMMT